MTSRFQLLAIYPCYFSDDAKPLNDSATQHISLLLSKNMLTLIFTCQLSYFRSAIRTLSHLYLFLPHLIFLLAISHILSDLIFMQFAVYPYIAVHLIFFSYLPFYPAASNISLAVNLFQTLDIFLCCLHKFGTHIFFLVT